MGPASPHCLAAMDSSECCWLAFADFAIVGFAVFLRWVCLSAFTSCRVCACVPMSCSFLQRDRQLWTSSIAPPHHALLLPLSRRRRTSSRQSAQPFLVRSCRPQAPISRIVLACWPGGHRHKPQYP